MVLILLERVPTSLRGELTRLQILFALSCVFLFLVIINGLFKYYINT